MPKPCGLLFEKIKPMFTAPSFSYSLSLSRLPGPAACSWKPEGSPVQRPAGAELGAGVPGQRPEAGGLPGAV